LGYACWNVMNKDTISYEELEKLIEEKDKVPPLSYAVIYFEIEYLKQVHMIKQLNESIEHYRNDLISALESKENLRDKIKELENRTLIDYIRELFKGYQK